MFCNMVTTDARNAVTHATPRDPLSKAQKTEQRPFFEFDGFTESTHGGHLAALVGAYEPAEEALFAQEAHD